MRPKRMWKYIVFFGAIFFLFLAGVVLFFWAGEVGREQMMVAQAAELADGRLFLDAAAILDRVKKGPWWRIRIWVGSPPPPVSMLHGAIGFELGQYEGAVISFQEAARSCSGFLTRFQFSEKFCRALTADAYTRSGDAIVRSRRGNFLQEAADAYIMSLRIVPDDPYNKRMLEWLFAETARKKKEKEEEEKGSEGGRGGNPLFQPPEFGEKDKTERGGH